MDDKEVEVSIEKQRRKWKQYSSGGKGTGNKARITYADTTKSGTQLEENNVTVVKQQ